MNSLPPRNVNDDQLGAAAIGFFLILVGVGASKKEY